MKTYNIAIIGLGHIAASYKYALENISHLKLIAVCDINPYALSKSLYEKYPFYLDYLEMIKHKDVDVAIVATPPANHAEIALSLLKNGIHVILEKPATLNLDDLKSIISFAKYKNLYVDTMFHWQYANEVLFVKQKYNDMSSFVSIKTEIYDPNAIAKNTISKEKVSLEGAWIDSGVNAISMYSILFDLSPFELNKSIHFIDKVHHQPYYAHHTFKHANQDIDLVINWRKNKNYKKTVITLPNKVIKIIHHLEEVYENNVLIYKSNEKERMSSHYYNYLKEFSTNRSNIEKNILIHKKLYMGVKHD
jgi:predicted dehydrogenase